MKNTFLTKGPDLEPFQTQIRMPLNQIAAEGATYSVLIDQSFPPTDHLTVGDQHSPTGART